MGLFSGLGGGSGDILVRIALSGSEKYNAEINKASQATERTAQNIDRALNVALLAAAAAFTGAVLAAGKFEKEMANVNTLIDVSDKEFQALSAGVLKIAQTVPVAISSLTKAEYDLISAGAEVGSSLESLELASMAATAGITGVDVAVRAGMATINAYGLDISQLSRVYDLQFSTVRKGVLTFEQLSSAIGNVLPSAANLGVSLEDLHGALAHVTKAGIDAQSASTYLARAFESMTENRDKWVELGVAIFDAGGSFRGLEPIIGDLSRELDGLTTEQKQMKLETLDMEKRSAKAILSMVNNYAGFEKTLNDVADSHGAMNDAFEKQMETMDAQANILKNTLQAAFIELGNEALPVITDLLKALNKNPAAIKAVVTAAAKLVLIFGSIAAAIKIATLAQKAYVAVQALFLTGLGPIGLAIGAIVTVMVAADAIQQALTEKRLKEIDAISDEVVELKTLGDRYGELITKQNLTIKEQEELDRITKILITTLGLEGDAVEDLKNNWEEVIKVKIENKIEDLTYAIMKAEDKQSDFLDITRLTKDDLEIYGGEVWREAQLLEAMKKELEDTTNELTKMEPASIAAKEATEALAEKTKLAAEAAAKAKEEYDAFVNSVTKLADAVKIDTVELERFSVSLAGLGPKLIEATDETVDLTDASLDLGDTWNLLELAVKANLKGMTKEFGYAIGDWIVYGGDLEFAWKRILANMAGDFVNIFLDLIKTEFTSGLDSMIEQAGNAGQGIGSGLLEGLAIFAGGAGAIIGGVLLLNELFPAGTITAYADLITRALTMTQTFVDEMIEIWGSWEAFVMSLTATPTGAVDAFVTNMSNMTAWIESVDAGDTITEQIGYWEAFQDALISIGGYSQDVADHLEYLYGIATAGAEEMVEAVETAVEIGETWEQAFDRMGIKTEASIRAEIAERTAWLAIMQEGTYEYEQMEASIERLYGTLGETAPWEEAAAAAIETAETWEQAFDRMGIETEASIRAEIAQREAWLAIMQKGTYEYKQQEAALERLYAKLGEEAPWVTAQNMAEANAQYIADQRALYEELGQTLAGLESEYAAVEAEIESLYQERERIQIQLDIDVAEQVGKIEELEALIVALGTGEIGLYEFNSAMNELLGLTNALTISWGDMISTMMGDFTQFEQDMVTATQTIEDILYFGIELDATEADETINAMIFSWQSYIDSLAPGSQAQIDAQAALDALIKKFLEMGGILDEEAAIAFGIDDAEEGIGTLQDLIDQLYGTAEDETAEIDLQIADALESLRILAEAIRIIVEQMYGIEIDVGFDVDPIPIPDPPPIIVDVGFDVGPLDIPEPDWPTPPPWYAPEYWNHEGGLITAHEGLLVAHDGLGTYKGRKEIPAILTEGERVMRPEVEEAFGSAAMANLNDNLDPSGLTGSPNITIVAHETTPNTWYEIYQDNMHGAKQNMERRFDSPGSPY